MPKRSRLILNTFILLTTLCLSCLLAFFIAEHFFFDKLFFNKSPLHGYPPLLASRTKDLDSLMVAAHKPGSRIFGTTDDGTYTIVLISDSIGFGVGVRANQTFPHILEQELSKHYPTKLYNLSNPGDNFIETYAKFLIAEHKLQPDLYIITLLNNDLLLFPENTDYPNYQIVKNHLQSLCLKPPFKTTSIDYFIAWEDLLKDYYVPAISPEYANICYFQQATREILTANPNVLFFSYNINPDEPIPSSEPYNTKQQDILIIKSLSSIIRKYGGQVYHSSFVFTRVSKSEGHPSAASHRQYAQTLYHLILENPAYKFPAAGKP